MKKNSMTTFIPQTVIDRTIHKSIPQSSKNNAKDSVKITPDKQLQNMHSYQSDIQSKSSKFNESNQDIIKKVDIFHRMDNNKLASRDGTCDEKSEILYLREMIENEIQQRKEFEIKMQKKITETHQIQCQELKELKELFLQREKNFNYEIDQLKKQIFTTINNQNIGFVDACRKQHTIYKNQISLQMGQLRQSFSHLIGQIKQWVAELQNKPSINQISDAFNELKQKILISSKSNEQAHNIICQLKDENQQIISKIKQIENNLTRFNNTIEQTENLTRQIIDQTIQNLQDDIEDKLTKIISSYNLNFAQIEENSIELKEMVSEILNINSMLSQKLITLVTNKLDSMTFQSTIQNINSKIHETVDINNKKINQIGQKEFQFEHQLRSLKDILDNLKIDYEKNYHKIKLQDSSKSINDSDIKSNIDSRILKQNFPVVLSPKNYDINYDFVRFKKNDQKDPIRKSGIQKIKKQKKYKGDEEQNKVQQNNLASELAQLGF